ncbi:GumC family protein [Arcticibacter sp.]|uniref:GumC family protein n=1 Tax=Arcticibacter sp. TaxID=1872630 RepID=UPI0038910BA5
MEILKDLFKYLKYWYVFLISVIFCLGVASVYLILSTPQYKISSTLLIKESNGSEAKGKESAFSDLDMFHSFSTVQNEIEVLRSKDLLIKVLEDLSLETKYFTKGFLKNRELYGDALPVEVKVDSLSREAYAKNKISLEILDRNRFVLNDSTFSKTYAFGSPIKRKDYTITVFKGPAFAKFDQPVHIEFRDLHTMAESYSLSKLVIMPIAKDANTIVLNLMDAVPQRGVEIMSKLIEKYNLENVHNKGIIARSTINFIDNRLKYLSEDLSSVAQDVESYKQQNMVTNLNSDAQFSVQNSGDYSRRLAATDVQISVINSIEKYLRFKGNSNNLVPSSLTVQDATLTSLMSKYNDLQLEKQRLLRSVRLENPLIFGIDQQLTGIKASIRESLANVKRNLVLERNSLVSSNSRYTSEIQKMPVLERGLLERNRAQAVKEGLFHYLLQKREETALSLSSTVPNSQVIDKPAYNSTPESPKSDLIYLCSFLAGIIFPVCGIYLKDTINAKVLDISDVKSIDGIRILGELSRKKKEEALIIKKDSRTAISELFRYIRMNLSFMNPNNFSQVLLVTSSMKGEGKTFFSINLGMSMAFINKTVVLLEFDFRKPDLLRYMGVTATTGLSDYLNADDVQLDDIIIPSEESPYLSVIGSGSISENPSELLMSYKIAGLIQELRNRFDYVIVDTSPVGQVADAFSLAPYTDASIYMVRYNFTNISQLEIIRDIAENKKLKNLQVVFNDAKRENGNAYGYGRYQYVADSAKKKELTN